MPVNLQEERDLLPQLRSESDLPTHRPDPEDDAIERSLMNGSFGRSPPENDMSEKIKELHPYAQTLSLQDLDSCLQLEEATFPENVRGTREKFQYRMHKASELCFGLFTSVDLSSTESAAATAKTAKAPDSYEPSRKGILIGHVIATKTTNEILKDGDMEIPTDLKADTDVGHREDGRTIAVHSLAILPQYQRLGLGTTLMKAYVQRMAESDIADQISILTYQHLVPFYEQMGFESKGTSDSKHGGEKWVDMVLKFENLHNADEEEE